MRLSTFVSHQAPFDILHSVVLFEIDVEGVASFEFESQRSPDERSDIRETLRFWNRFLSMMDFRR